MLFGVKIRPFVSATSRRSRRGFAPVANVAAIGRPKMAYRDGEKNLMKVLNGFDSFFFYLGANMYGYVCLTGSRKCVRSVII